MIGPPLLCIAALSTKFELEPIERKILFLTFSQYSFSVVSVGRSIVNKTQFAYQSQIF